MTKPQCIKCRFFQPDREAPPELADSVLGTCRRYAPRPQTDYTYTEWPVVMPEDWCGEYQA